MASYIKTIPETPIRSDSDFDFCTFTEETPRVFALIQAAGWPIWPIILASIVAVAIIGERIWALRLNVVAPRDLLPPAVASWAPGYPVTGRSRAKRP